MFFNKNNLFDFLEKTVGDILFSGPFTHVTYGKHFDL